MFVSQNVYVTFLEKCVIVRINKGKEKKHRIILYDQNEV